MSPPRLLEILTAVARLLSGGRISDVQASLEHIGRTLRVDRMYLFENRVDPHTGRTLCTQRFEWAADGVSAEIDNETLRDLPYDEVSHRIEATLRSGEVFAKTADELEPMERAHLEPQAIQSLCLVPVFVPSAVAWPSGVLDAGADEEADPSPEAEWWGFVGFDDCHAPRRWSEEEIAVLRLVSAILGGHFHRERMRETLARSERHHRHVVASVREILFELDAAGRLTFLSQAWEQLGHSVDRSLGRPLSDFVAEGHREQLEHIREVTQRSDQLDCLHELPFVAWDGSELRMEMHCRFNRDRSGAVVQTIGTLTDVTERRRAEESLRQRRLDDSLAALAGGIAHDFNNVLHGVLTATELLERRMGEDRFLAVIRTSAERMADLTGKLVAYARGGRYRSVSLDLAALVEDASEILSDRIPPGVELTLEAGEHPSVEGDRAGIFQVILNLLTNALEAMPEGGRLRVAVDEVDVGADHPQVRSGQLRVGPYARLSVQDEGAGIPASRVARIFEPYFSTKSRGRGLGLAAARGIVTGHGGAISLQSELGRGSTFRVLLPRSGRAPERRPGPPPPRTRPGGRDLILLVDDDPAILRTTAADLEEAGYRVMTAMSGAEALTRFEQGWGLVRCAVVDYLLPDIDGATLLGMLAERDPDVRLLLFTGQVAEEVPRPSGLDELTVLQKPFGSAALRSAVAEALDGGEGESEDQHGNGDSDGGDRDAGEQTVAGGAAGDGGGDGPQGGEGEGEGRDAGEQTVGSGAAGDGGGAGPHGGEGEGEGRPGGGEGDAGGGGDGRHDGGDGGG